MEKGKEEMQKNTQFTPSLLLTLLSFSLFLLSLLLALLLGPAAAKQFPFVNEVNFNIFLWVNLCASTFQLISLLPLALYTFRGWQVFHLSFSSFFKILMLFLLFLPLNTLFLQLLVYVLDHFFGVFAEPQAVLISLQEAKKSPFVIPFLFAYIGVMVPFIEEILFRGFLFGWLHRYMKFFLSAFFTSCIFSAAHISWGNVLLPQFPLFVGLFITSWVLCALYSSYRSLFAPILFHSLFNLVNLSLLFL